MILVGYKDTLVVAAFFMKPIYVYTGIGAYQAKDIENFLAVFELKYKRIDEGRFSELKPPAILIIPGGQVTAYLSAWGEKGIGAIRRFVSDGGIYIGICSGVYVAGISFKGASGLNFFDKELRYDTGQKIIDVLDETDNRFELI